MVKFDAIPLHYRRTRCQEGQCSSYAQYAIYLPTKAIKLCTFHIHKLVTSMCEFGFVRKSAQIAIDEKGL